MWPHRFFPSGVGVSWFQNLHIHWPIQGGQTRYSCYSFLSRKLSNLARIGCMGAGGQWNLVGEQTEIKRLSLGAPNTKRCSLYDCFKISKFLWFLKSQRNGLEDTECKLDLWNSLWLFLRNLFLQKCLLIDKSSLLYSQPPLSRSNLKSPSKNIVP